MALSNIFREPRREITESAVGIAIVAGFLYGDYCFAAWLYSMTADNPRGGFPVVLGMIMGVVFFIVCIGMLVLTHALGEAICNALAKRGLELRPRQRR